MAAARPRKGRGHRTSRAKSEAPTPELTPYEAIQVEAISEWKSERPSTLAEVIRGLAWPLAKLVAKTVPRGQVARVVEAMAERAKAHDHVADILKAAGASSLAEASATGRWRPATPWRRRSADAGPRAHGPARRSHTGAR